MQDVTVELLKAAKRVAEKDKRKMLVFLIDMAILEAVQTADQQKEFAHPAKIPQIPRKVA